MRPTSNCQGCLTAGGRSHHGHLAWLLNIVVDVVVIMLVASVIVIVVAAAVVVVVVDAVIFIVVAAVVVVVGVDAVIIIVVDAVIVVAALVLLLRTISNSCLISKSSPFETKTFLIKSFSLFSKKSSTEVSLMFSTLRLTISEILQLTDFISCLLSDFSVVSGSIPDVNFCTQKSGFFNLITEIIVFSIV